MSAIKNPRPSSRLTYDERMAELAAQEGIMSTAPVFAKYVRVGDLVWHSIARAWLPLVEVYITDGQIAGWVRDETLPGSRAWIPGITSDGLVMVSTAARTSPAPLYKVGDRVIFEGRASLVEDVQTVNGTVVLTVSDYATRSLIGEKHPDLAPAE